MVGREGQLVKISVRCYKWGDAGKMRKSRISRLYKFAQGAQWVVMPDMELKRCFGNEGWSNIGKVVSWKALAQYF